MLARVWPGFRISPVCFRSLERQSDSQGQKESKVVYIPEKWYISTIYQNIGRIYRKEFLVSATAVQYQKTVVYILHSTYVGEADCPLVTAIKVDGPSKCTDRSWLSHWCAKRGARKAGTAINASRPRKLTVLDCWSGTGGGT